MNWTRVLWWTNILYVNCIIRKYSFFSSTKMSDIVVSDTFRFPVSASLSGGVLLCLVTRHLSWTFFLLERPWTMIAFQEIIFHDSLYLLIYSFFLNNNTTITDIVCIIYMTEITRIQWSILIYDRKYYLKSGRFDLLMMSFW